MPLKVTSKCESTCILSPLKLLEQKEVHPPCPPQALCLASLWLTSPPHHQPPRSHASLAVGLAATLLPPLPSAQALQQVRDLPTTLPCGLQMSSCFLQQQFSIFESFVVISALIPCPKQPNTCLSHFFFLLPCNAKRLCLGKGGVHLTFAAALPSRPSCTLHRQASRC
jgi:hypothetical protein